MRVTDKMGYNQVTANMQKNRTEMADFQNQAATQKRVTKPSDDPVSAAKVLGVRSDERGATQFTKNINSARSFLESTDQSLSELSEILMRAKELAIQQSSDAGASGETRRVVAEEIKQIYSQAIQIGNRKLGERYIFGGYQTTKPPFDNQGNYYGDDGDMKIHANKDAFIAMNLSGDKVFLGKGIGADGLARQKGETPRDHTELQEYQQGESERIEKMRENEQQEVKIRGPASIGRSEKAVLSNVEEDSRSINILQSLKDFEIALRVNDKDEIQQAIDNIDYALTQTVHSRAQVGARIQALSHTQDTLQKAIVDSKLTASQLEDADLFQVVSDMSKTDSSLKATLETSGKIIQPSLLDFLNRKSTYSSVEIGRYVRRSIYGIKECSMLVLTRKLGESIAIDDHIKIRVVQIKGKQVRLGIEAPKETKIHREEVYLAIQDTNKESAAVTSESARSISKMLKT